MGKTYTSRLDVGNPREYWQRIRDMLEKYGEVQLVDVAGREGFIDDRGTLIVSNKPFDGGA